MLLPRSWARALVVVPIMGSLCALALASPTTALAASTISGALRDAQTSALISGADVAMTLEQQPSGGIYSVSASQIATSGVYSFTGLASGTYRLLQTGVGPFGYFPPQQNPGPAILVDGVKDVTVDWPLTLTGFGGGVSTVSGRILDSSSGTVILGSTTWVWLDQRAPDGTWSHIGDSFRTDGTYAFSLLGQGVYRVRFVGPPPAAYQLGASSTSYSLAVDGANDVAFDWMMLGSGEPAPLNHAPVAAASSPSAAENTDLTIRLSATDADGDALTYSIVSGPSHGSLGPVSDNKVIYTPANGYTGTDSFNFRTSDGQADSNVSTVAINVEYANKGTGPTSWSTAIPSVGAVVSASRPTISIPLYDAAGFKGKPYYGVKVDGRAQLPIYFTLVDAKHATLRHVPNAIASLGPGIHTVQFSAMNGAGVWSTYTWWFTVVAP